MVAAGDGASVFAFGHQGSVVQMHIGSLHTTSFQLRGPLNVLRTCEGGLAGGGRENDLQIYDAATHQTTWSAKNVPFDNLKLRVPIWINDLAFLGDTNTPSNARLVTGTAYKQLRLYDTRASAKPKASIEIGDFSITKVAPTTDALAVFVGDASGELYHYDLRTMKRMHTLASSAGSIRALHLGPADNTLLSASLDSKLTHRPLSNAPCSLLCVYVVSDDGCRVPPGAFCHDT